ncbi:MAG: PAS domain S-box protein [Ignavibacteriaceae bacterium]|nr:PAS domain S-box protein [Ignavibacteriaceae bacterium]
MEKKNILIVEDEGIIAMDLQNRLVSLGYNVIDIVSTGKEAISIAQTKAPDLILLDIMLKGNIDGIDAAQKIRTENNIPVIFLSAYADEKTLERAKLAEPYGYILKPFEERELHSTIKVALYKHSIEKKLKENERWLFTTLQSIGDAVITTDVDRNITFVNRRTEELTGWKMNELIGRDICSTIKFINEETGEELLNPVLNVLETNSSYNLAAKTSLITRSGKEISIDDSAAPIIDEKGNTTGVVLVFRDIFERRKAEIELNRFQNHLEELVEKRTKELTEVNVQLENEIAEHLQTEDALKISAERFRNIFEESPIGIIFFAPDGSFVHMNKASYKIFGLSNVLELDGYNLLHNSFLSEEQRDKLLKKESLRIEQLFDFDFFKRESIYRVIKTGEVYADLLISPLFSGEDSMVIGYLVHIQDISERKKYESALTLHQENLEDLILERTRELAETNDHLQIEITERKRSESSLRESERKLSTLINNLSGIAYRCSNDEKRTMNYLSDGCLELTGYQIENLIGDKQISFNSLIHPDDRNKVVTRIKYCAANNKPYQNEYRLFTKSGEEKWVLDKGLPVNSINPEENYLEGFIIDITQRIWAEEAIKKYSEELKELNNSKDKFFSIIAHDLKSPFQGLLGCSNFLLNEFDSLDTTDKWKLAQDINGASKNLYKLIENLLHWARMQRSNMDFQAERINLFDEVNYVFKILESSAKNKNISLLNQTERNIHINADLNMLNSVFQNLISNAIKFTPEGGKVAVSASTNGAFAEITVSDSGVGIKSEDLIKLFRIDSHFSTKGTNNEEGTGLGLILCKEMIEKHKCSIWAESDYGKGAKFKFTIPKFPDPD